MQLIGNKDDFYIVKNNLTNRKVTFAIEKRGNSNYFLHGKKRTTAFKEGDKSLAEHFKDPIAKRLIMDVHQQVDSYIKQSGLHIEPTKPLHPPFYKESSAYKELEVGMELCYIDIKHAYWRVAYINGYISKHLYNLVAEDEKYKLCRNIALSTLVSQRKRDYYFDGVFLHTIDSDKSMREVIYTNIRQTTYNLIGGLAEAIGDACFTYRVDGLLTVYDQSIIDYAHEYFNQKEILFGVDRCTKVSDNDYYLVSKDKIKKF